MNGHGGIRTRGTVWVNCVSNAWNDKMQYFLGNRVEDQTEQVAAKLSL